MVKKPNYVYLVVQHTRNEKSWEQERDVQLVTASFQAAQAYCRKMKAPLKNERIDHHGRRFWYWFTIKEWRLDDDESERWVDTYDWSGNCLEGTQPIHGYAEDGYPGKDTPDPETKTPAPAPVPVAVAWSTGAVRPVVGLKS